MMREGEQTGQTLRRWCTAFLFMHCLYGFTFCFRVSESALFASICVHLPTQENYKMLLVLVQMEVHS